MKLDLYQIDAFTNKVFGGNPACVMPLENWLPDEVLLEIAKENAVAETAFFVDKGEKIHLRWFTPEIEMDLCGHATLATAHCLKTILNYPKNEIVFETASGDLTVSFENDLYVLDFPSRMPIPATLPKIIEHALSMPPKAVFKARDYVLVYDSQVDIESIKVNRQLIDQINLDLGGVVITAEGTDCDFVSRFFTPQASIFEDPVTGSAHCSLIPFWAQKLDKQKLFAKQLSEREGTLFCEDNGERVLIKGQAVTYFQGSIFIEI